MKKILVGIDGSEGAARAARWAAELAKATDSTLELIYVYDAPAAIQLGLRTPPERELDGEDARSAFASAQKAIGGLVPAEHQLVTGHPAAEITARADEIDASLIVLGSLGLRSLEGVMLGSVARVVLERSGRPVTVVH